MSYGTPLCLPSLRDGLPRQCTVPWPTDWFEWARMKGGSMLWTEDWMPDSASHRWSYYSARMRSAIALSNHSEGMSFSGYIVTRSSGGQEGGLLQRPLTMVGSGAKAVRYCTRQDIAESRL